jgi:alpha-amylase
MNWILPGRAPTNSPERRRFCLLAGLGILAGGVHDQLAGIAIVLGRHQHGPVLNSFLSCFAGAMMRTSSSRTKLLGLAVCCATGLAVQLYASSCSISPSSPTSGQSATITYDPAGGPLAGSSAIYIHLGNNSWNPVQSPDPAMTLSNGLYVLTYTVPPEAIVVNCCFNDGTTWDNNASANWNFTVTPGVAPIVGPPPPLPTNASTAGVMMQGFYWDCPSGWYNTMASKAAALRNMQGGYGIDRIWFPPPQKSDSGGLSMGYDPYDYYDVGQYYQKGTTATHFGTQNQLKNAITAYRTNGIVSMADLVLNHRKGGANESNPNTGTTTATDFRGVASGKCTWRYNQFHPSTFELTDQGIFSNYPDVCHVTGTTAGSAYYDQIAWAQWLTNANNAGFDGGWRFDMGNSYKISVLADLRSSTANAFGVGEFTWGLSTVALDSCVKFSGNTHAFDFPGVSTMTDVFTNGANIGRLVDPAYVFAARNPADAVTFVANHDQDRITTNKMLAYCYILTYQGYPCIFWHDYFDNGLATLGGQPGNGINPLVWARGALAGGQPAIQLLKTNDANLLVYGTLNGSNSAPGYIVAINTHKTSAKSATVTTANTFLYGKNLQCYAWYSYAAGQNTQPASVSCSSSGGVTVQVPASGYAVYAPEPCSSPAVPDGLSAAGGNAQVVVSWAAASGATSYNVARATTGAGPYTQIADGISATSCTNTGLAGGTTYFYKINAVNSCATSSPSAYISAATIPAVPNTPPALAAVPDQTIMAGRTLIVTNSASDTNVPAQTLLYSLANPPPGASINSTSGVFAWRPAMAQAPSTQAVSIVVSDNGVPSLSATQSFLVAVTQPASPALGPGAIIDGHFAFSVNGAAGPDYTIQTSTDMVSWLALFTSNSPVLPFVWTDVNSTTSPCQFYRVYLGP